MSSSACFPTEPMAILPRKTRCDGLSLLSAERFIPFRIRRDRRELRGGEAACGALAVLLFQQASVRSLALGVFPASTSGPDFCCAERCRRPMAGGPSTTPCLDPGHRTFGASVARRGRRDAHLIRWWAKWAVASLSRPTRGHPGALGPDRAVGVPIGGTVDVDPLMSVIIPGPSPSPSSGPCLHVWSFYPALLRSR